MTCGTVEGVNKICWVMLRLANMLYMPHHHTEEFHQEIRAWWIPIPFESIVDSWSIFSLHFLYSRTHHINKKLNASVVLMVCWVVLRLLFKFWQVFLFLDPSHRPDNQKWHCKSRPKSLHDVVSSQILTLATFVLLRSSSMAWQAIYMMLWKEKLHPVASTTPSFFGYWILWENDREYICQNIATCFPMFVFLIQRFSWCFPCSTFNILRYPHQWHTGHRQLSLRKGINWNIEQD